jgi:hypothetical protein
MAIASGEKEFRLRLRKLGAITAALNASQSNATHCGTYSHLVENGNLKYERAN